MDWHGCPDPNAYCPPEHCSDPVAHHRIQARKRAEAAFGGAAKGFPPSIHFRGVAEEKVTARTVYNEGSSAKPHFDPAPFLKERRVAAASGGAEDDMAQSGKEARSSEATLPHIPATDSAGVKVPLLKLGQLNKLPDRERAQSLSARSATSAFKSTTQRGPRTARETIVGWQPLRSRRSRDEKVDPEQLLETLFPEMHQDLKLLLDKDFVEKLSGVRTNPELDGDVQQRLRAMVAETRGAGATDAGDIGGVVIDGINERKANVAEPLAAGREEVSGIGDGVARGKFGKTVRKVSQQAGQAGKDGDFEQRAAICRPVLPHLFLGALGNDTGVGAGDGQDWAEAGVSSTAGLGKVQQPLKGGQSLAPPTVRSGRKQSITESARSSRRRSSNSSDRSSKPEPSAPTKRVPALAIDTTMRKKMETVSAELEEYKRKVRELEIQLSVTSPRKAEEKLQKLEARLQEQISVLEKQYRLKVDNIRAAHRTELADWKASEAESIRTALERACEAKLKAAAEEREGVQRRLLETQTQAQAAEESASQEKALRAPMEAEVTRLRRHCKAIESRSRALERELLELQARAGDTKGAARLLSEPVVSHPAFSRHFSLRSDSLDIARQSSFLSDASDGARTEASNSIPEDRTLSQSNSGTYSSVPDGSQTERTPARRRSNRLAFNMDAAQTLSRIAGTSSVLPSGAQTERTRGGFDRRTTLASEEALLTERGSPAAKRTLLDLSSPSLHMSLDFSEQIGLEVISGDDYSGTAEEVSKGRAPLGPGGSVRMPVFPPERMPGKPRADIGRQAVGRSLTSLLPNSSSGWR
ncbi:hypothetical protein KFL_000290440 [Klebsormidium nitens]|uniref:Uncharacterized protein n=1 Tax=Klebsormidium nitens TaxID=105231 RepID=A0A1Y1HLA8_KLENI|nr:hypothetical protein KFL_000290440 [Klebsormidium nitens]|eukprot:GAQ79394.1 hypothetical protein KFL_000290440 [Klebsormidium nitens]